MAHPSHPVTLSHSTIFTSENLFFYFFFLLEGASVITRQARPILITSPQEKWLPRVVFDLLAGEASGWRGKSKQTLPGWRHQPRHFSRYSSAVISSFSFVDGSSEARRQNFIRFSTRKYPSMSTQAGCQWKYATASCRARLHTRF